jgi:hypothetical protein
MLELVNTSCLLGKKNRTESPRVCRRLHLLRGWNNEKAKEDSKEHTLSGNDKGRVPLVFSIPLARLGGYQDLHPISATFFFALAIVFFSPELKIEFFTCRKE